jgi:hypothetical protein
MNVDWMRRYEGGGARDWADCWERNDDVEGAINSNIATR